VWETQGVGTDRTAASVVGGTPDYRIPGTSLRAGDVWRICQKNQMDMFCRDRFRIELTRTSLTIFVNGYKIYDIQGLYASNPATGADNRIPESFLNNAHVYFASWNNGKFYPVYRFHWGRVAVNPHGPDGSALPPSAAPFFCLGQPQSTCPMSMSNDHGAPATNQMPAMPQMPGMPRMPTAPPMTDMPSPTDAPPTSEAPPPVDNTDYTMPTMPMPSSSDSGDIPEDGAP
jgi:hypothetical protein